jgi:nitrite reductase/ring-hydroxylating ferredoxin subunit
VPLTKEQNDFLTLTGKGTPCGEFLRRYWQPVALSDELAQGGPPLPVRLLGEDLVAYRDTRGTLGLLGRRCSHRGADLAYAELEDDGIRCYYHGWLYNERGRCLDQPLEPPDSPLKDQIQHLAYPVVERAGIVFGYLGPGEAPLLPEYEFLTVPEENRRGARYLVECNFLQAAEASVDPVQKLMFERLFRGRRGTEEPFSLGGPDMRVDTEVTDFGVRLFALSRAEGGTGLEIRDFMLPCVATLSGVGIDGYSVHWHVPIDDTHHWRYVWAFRRSGPISDEEARTNGVEKIEGYRIARDLKERDANDDANFVAYAVSLAESQGPMFDRSQEHLVATDQGIVAMRALVHKGISDVEEGADPPHVIRDPAANHFSLEAREELLPPGADPRQAVKRP